MRVATTYAIDDTRVEEAARPDPGEGEAVLRVRACGVCASDAADWYVAKKAPSVLGHEPVGDVVAVGAGVSAVKEGDRVFFHHHVPCGECKECRRGLVTNCALFRTTKLDPGGFAEYVRVGRENLVRDTLALPAAVSDDAGTFIEPLACSIRAFDKAPPRPDDTVLIIGLGVMGLLNVQVARSHQPARIVATDFVPMRRERAKALGADEAWDPRETDVAAALAEMTGGRGADLIIVGPPTPKAFEAAYAAAAPGAALVLFAPYSPDAVLQIAPHDFYFKEMRLTASYSCGPGETREALDLIAKGTVKVDELVSHRFDLSGVGDAITLTAGKGESLKSVVYPHGVPGA